MRTTLKTIAAVVIAAVTGTALTACGGSAKTTGNLLNDIQAGTVILGSKYDQPGMGQRTPNDKMSGLDVDIAQYVVNKIADDRGWAHPQVTWRETPSGQRETVIQNGEVDMITGTYSINKGRANSVNFGGPYLVTHQALLVRQDSNDITGLEGLDGKILCSVTGSTPAQKVKKALPGVQLQEYDTYSSCVEALNNKNVDAITTDATILSGYAAQRPGKFKVVAMNKDGKPFTNEYYGIGLKKGDQASTDAINKAIQAMYDDGSFDRFINDNLGSSDNITKGKPGDLSFLN